MNKRRLHKGLSAIMACALFAASVTVSPLGAAAEEGGREIVNLTTNGLANPLGIDSAVPVFGWQMASDETGAAQSAYRIVVADEDGNVVWDSGQVDSGLAQNIPYEGPALAPKTRYAWCVAVTDENGSVWTSEADTFETSFMDESYASWGEAKWIGAGEKALDAASANFFDLTVNLKIAEGGTKASVIFGADDDRLNNKAFNVWNKAGENYFQAEIDISDPEAPMLNLYAVGLPSKALILDENGEPVMTQGWGGASFTYELQEEENPKDEPDMSFAIPAEAFAQSGINDEMSLRIMTPTINKLTVTVNGVDAIAGIELNPLGGTHDYNSFPNLNSIGFAVPAGETAAFTGLTLHEYNLSGAPELDGILFDENTGATYQIFEGLEGVTVDGGEISVSGGENGVLVYADPSYGASPMVRTVFDTQGKEVAKARMYVAAQGNYEVTVNGQPVTDGWFNPGNEEYSTTMPYHIYDVTGLLAAGENAIGAQLAQGWWSGHVNYTNTCYNYYGTKQAILMRVDLTYADGTSESIYTNTDDWQVSVQGPVKSESHYQGERYSAVTAAQYAGWDTPAYEAGEDWEAPVEILPRMNDFAFAVRYDSEATIVKELSVVEALGEVIKNGEGTGAYIYDMGENVIGVPRITIPEGYVNEGDEVIIRYAEILYPDLPEYEEQGLVGSMMVENLRAALCTDYYIAAAGEQVFEPHFTFHGYRYIEISGLSKPLPEECIKTEVLSSVKVTAQYDSSNELVNRLFKNVQNSQTSNFLSLPTDCPQRNERLGWTGDAQVFSLAASYHADVYNFYRNWLKSVRACQRLDGSLEVYNPTATPKAPAMIGFGFSGISWDAALIVIPYNMYKQYGNPAILEDNIEAIDLYFDYLIANPMSEEYPHLTSKTGILADWLSVDSTDAAEINNAVYGYLAGLSCEIASVLGREDLVSKYSALYEAVKAEWNACYLDPETGKTADDTEASYATPLRYGMVADELIEKAVANYVETVKAAGYTITSGFSGTPNLVPVLTMYGYIDDAYKLFEQTEYASWLYPVVNGATSVWERWNSYTIEGGFNGNNSMNSFNHFSLGAISEWMTAFQLGITTDSVGYKEFVLAPVPGGSFTYANGTYESNYGTIASGWTAEDGALTSYEATVPANTSATLYLPITEEQAAALALPEGVSYEGMAVRNNVECAQFALEAGSYNFTF